jgi:hypothetical protein
MPFERNLYGNLRGSKSLADRLPDLMCTQQSSNLKPYDPKSILYPIEVTVPGRNDAPMKGKLLTSDRTGNCKAA